jgi:hypothetical protein
MGFEKDLDQKIRWRSRSALKSQKRLLVPERGPGKGTKEFFNGFDPWNRKYDK